MQREERLALGKMDPELETLLKQLPPRPAPPSDISEIRQGFDKICLAKRQGHPNLPDVVTADVAVPARDGRSIPVRTYRPQTPPGGGGWMMGGLETADVECRMFAQQLGMVVVNVDYRLAPEHPFPAGVNDSWDATKWAAQHAHELGADPTKGFIVGGASAGGNLADAVGHLARDEKLSPPITGLWECIPLLCHPDAVPAEYKDEFLSYEQNKDALTLARPQFRGMLAALQPDPKSPRFSTFLHPDGHKGLPPVFFQVAGMDPLRDEALVYERVLRTQAGVKTKLRLYPGLPHGFNLLFPQLTASGEAERDAMEGMKWLLGGGK